MAKKTKKKKNSVRLLLKNISRTIGISWKVDKGGLLMYLGTVIITAFLPFVISYLNAQSLNLIVQYLAGSTNDTTPIISYFIASVSVDAVYMYLWQLNDYSGRLHWINLHEYMAVEVPRKIASLDIQKFESTKFKNLINRVNKGYSHKPGSYIESLIWSTSALVSFLSAAAILFNYNLWLLPLVIISLTPELIIQLRSSKMAWGIWDAKGEADRKYNYASWYLTSSEYIEEIRIYKLNKYILSLIEMLFKDFQDEQRRLIRKTRIYSTLASTFETAIEVGIQFWVLSGVLARAMQVGDFTFISRTVSSLSNNTQAFFRRVNRLYDDNLFMSDLFKLLDTENIIVSKLDAVPVPKTTVPKIEFRNVSFKYPKSEKFVFEDLNITINPGEDIALVGENGAGKTTLVKLLLRFYDVTEGQILINDIDIRDIELETYYENIGVLFQNFNEYYFPVKENIYVGDIEREINQEQVEDAAKKAGAHGFVSKYKKKYDQILNKEFKNGIKPSGGQWQRVALARAFYRNANILILDEPTSAIDAKGEFEIFQEINKFQKEKTTIIISHRFSTVRNADKIYVIEEGKIIESGSHLYLMKIEKGKYKEMFEIQAEGYK
jgi:ABC-type multidrug transport system fused ATPase/permease subunit